MDGLEELVGGAPGAAEVEVAEAPADPMEAVRAMDTEPESITKWKAEKAKRLEEEAAAEKAAIAELEEKAAATMGEWNATYASKLKSIEEKNAEGEKAFVAKMTTKDVENPWEKVAFMIDFNAKTTGKDTSKMKSLLIRLKTEGLLNRN